MARLTDSLGREDVPSDAHDGARLAVVVDRVHAGLGRLSGALGPSGEAAALSSLPDPSRLGARISSSRAGARDEAWRLHEAVAAVLGAVDGPFAAVYDIGWSLAQASAPDRNLTELLGNLAAPGTGISDHLETMAPLFPPHSARAVATSVREWSKWATDEARRIAGMPADEAAQVAAQLQKSGEQWRSLLSGERDGASILTPQDYTAVADRVLVHHARVATAVVRRLWPPVSVLAAIVLIGFVLIFAFTGWARIIAGLGLVLGAGAALLVTVGNWTARATGLFEQPLWEAEYDRMIAERVAGSDTAYLPHSRGYERAARQLPEREAARDHGSATDDAAEASGSFEPSEASNASPFAPGPAPTTVPRDATPDTTITVVAPPPSAAPLASAPDPAGETLLVPMDDGQGRPHQEMTHAVPVSLPDDRPLGPPAPLTSIPEEHLAANRDPSPQQFVEVPPGPNAPVGPADSATDLAEVAEPRRSTQLYDVEAEGHQSPEREPEQQDRPREFTLRERSRPRDETDRYRPESRRPRSGS